MDRSRQTSNKRPPVEEVMAPMLIMDKSALSEALTDSWATLQFALFWINESTSEQQRVELVLRYNALMKQCKLPPGSEMVGLDDPEFQPIPLADLLTIIKHIEGIHRLMNSEEGGLK